MASLCEACESAPAEVREPSDYESPYILCTSCAERFRSKALRPGEWFNLAKRHSWRNRWLSDSWYDDDGTAGAAEHAVENASQFPAPTLEQMRSTSSLLLDYTIAKWRISAALRQAWLHRPRDEVIETLTKRYAVAANRQVRARVLEVASLTVANAGAELVSHAWGDCPDNVELDALSQASAACLPRREGLSRVFDALTELAESERRSAIHCLAHFRASEVLDWIEQNAPALPTNHWGYLAACSSLDWPRAKRWLESGRPLSLVALDALVGICGRPTLHLKTFQPKLLHPPTADQVSESLRTCEQIDSVPRVRAACSFLHSHTDQLLATDQI